MKPREPLRPGAPSVHPHRRTGRAFLALAALVASSGAFAANECQVKYTYATSMTTSASATKNINEGSSVDIPNSQGSKVLYVENQKSHTIRVYRTGFGQYVDLGANGRDPGLGNYPPGTTLQKVQCPAGSSSSSSGTQLSVQQLVNAAFQAVTQATLAGYNLVANKVGEAQAWANKTAADWGSCPSAGAQNAYNKAKEHRSQIDAMLAQAQQIKADADAARNNCLATTGNAPLCTSTYNGLPVHGWISSLVAAKASVTTAMNTMAALQCPSGCAQTAQLPVAYPNIKPGGTHNVRVPGKVNLQMCTNLDLGSIGFNPSAVASGNLQQIVQAKPPSCTSTTSVAVCTDWDLDALLAELKRLKIVPPEISKITVDIPTQKIPVVTGVEQASCQQELRVCEPSGNLTISLNEGKDLFSGGKACANYVPIACQNPPFGLRPATQLVDAPDLTKAKVNWSKEAFGSITVDLSAPNFAKLCRGNARDLPLPKMPTINMEVKNVPLNFICTQPTFTKVVANP